MKQCSWVALCVNTLTAPMLNESISNFIRISMPMSNKCQMSSIRTILKIRFFRNKIYGFWLQIRLGINEKWWKINDFPWIPYICCMKIQFSIGSIKNSVVIRRITWQYYRNGIVSIYRALWTVNGQSVRTLHCVYGFNMTCYVNYTIRNQYKNR